MTRRVYGVDRAIAGIGVAATIGAVALQEGAGRGVVCPGPQVLQPCFGVGALAGETDLVSQGPGTVPGRPEGGAQPSLTEMSATARSRSASLHQLLDR